MGKTVELSVIVCAYNPSWKAMQFTLDSFLQQKNISYEIIIADDGSKDNLFQHIKKYFDQHNFLNYILIKNPVNKGTVCNLISGLNVANGEFVKTISPGDAIYGDNTLRKWIDFLKSENLSWAFSDAINYNLVNDEIIVVSDTCHPMLTAPYVTKDFDERRWYYLVFGDIALGAAILARRDLQIKYCEIIKDKIIYAEDHIWRMMMFDGIVGGYFNNLSILYEYGTGVSTCGSEFWAQKLKEDWLQADKIIRTKTEINTTQKELLSDWNKFERGGWRKILIRGFWKYRIRKHFCKRKTIDFLPEKL